MVPHLPPVHGPSPSTALSDDFRRCHVVDVAVCPVEYVSLSAALACSYSSSELTSVGCADLGWPSSVLEDTILIY